MVTTGAAWVMCPVCRRGKLLRLTEGTRAQGLVLFCLRCKHESVVEIGPEKAGAQGLPRVWLSAGGLGIPPSLGGGRKGALWTGGQPFPTAEISAEGVNAGDPGGPTCGRVMRTGCARKRHARMRQAGGGRKSTAKGCATPQGLDIAEKTPRLWPGRVCAQA